MDEWLCRIRQMLSFTDCRNKQGWYRQVSRYAWILQQRQYKSFRDSDPDKTCDNYDET